MYGIDIVVIAFLIAVVFTLRSDYKRLFGLWDSELKRNTELLCRVSELNDKILVLKTQLKERGNVNG